MAGKEYNFDYFDRMNQKEKEAKQKQPASSQSAGPPARERNRPPPASSARPPGRAAPTRPPDSPGRDEREMRQEMARRNRQAARQQQEQTAYRREEAPRRPGEEGQASRGQKPKGKPPSSKKKDKPRKEPAVKKKKRKPKPQLTPEQRAKRKRRKWILFYISLFLAVVAAGVTLSVTVLFKIDTIEVTGVSRYSMEEILETSGIQEGENLFMMDKGAAIERLEQELPYVGSVRISRHLPGRVVIQVDDVVIAGAVQNVAGYLIIGANGKALEQVSALPEGVPVLIGVDLSQTEIGQMVTYADPQQQEMIESLATIAHDNDLDQITQIDISDPYNLKLVYDDRITIKLGLPTDLDYKMQFVRSLIVARQEIGENEKGELDVSLARETNEAYFNPDYSISSSSTASASSSTSSASDPASSADSSGVSSGSASQTADPAA